MRTLSYFLLSIFIVSLTACSSDDDGPSSSDDIFGKWFLSDMTMEGTFVEEGEEFSFTGKAKDIHEDNYIIFKEDNKFNGSSTPIDMELTISFMGQTHTQIISTGTNMPQSGTWERNGNKLILSADGGEETEYTVETFTSSSIVLTADETSVDMGSDFPPGAKFSVSISFRR